MTDTDRGPLRRFEVTWENGHMEIVEAHQCIAPHTLFSEPATRPRWMFHGEIDGHWVLILAARDEDIRTVRNVTADERVTP